jgi:uncharacterized membrane protein YesL
MTMLPLSHGTLGRIFDTVYLALLTNLLLVACCLPVILVLSATDPARFWAVAAVALPLLAPAFTAASVVFAEYAEHDGGSLLRAFARAWRTHLRRSLLVGGAATASLVVLGVDVRVVSSSRAGWVALPILLVLAALVLLTAVLTLVAVPERPDVPVVKLARAAVFLGLRRWYLSLASLAVLALLAAVAVSRPAIGLGLAAAPLLHVVWANSRFALQPILSPAVTAPTQPARK